MLIELKNKRRLPAIDIFRGLAIAIMLLVNSLPNFEQAYPLLLHAPWAGLTLADLAFPGFVFIMGTAGALWFPKHEWDNSWDKFNTIFRRSALLILLGIVLNQLPILLQHIFYPPAGVSLWTDIAEHGRLLGVLQRLGLVYFFGMIITWWLRSEKLIAIMALLLLFLSSTCFHLYDTTNPFSPDNNISMLIDGLFPGAAHCYQGKAFDPEGLYGTIAGGFMWLLGLLQMSCSMFPDFTEWLFTPFRLLGHNPLFMFVVPDRILLFLWYLPVQGVPVYVWLWQNTLLGVLGAPLSILVYAALWVILWLPAANFLYKRQIIFKL